MPIVSLIQNQKKSLFLAMGVCVGYIVPFYLATTYTNEILKNKVGLSANMIMAISSGLMFFWVILIPFMGKLADKVGIKRLMGAASIGLMLVAYPAFSFAVQDPQLWKVLTMQIVISFFGIMFSAPFNGVFAYLFPPKERYTGSGLAYALGAALFGGMTPLAALNLVEWTGNQSSPAILLIVSAIVGFTSVMLSKTIDHKTDILSINDKNP